MSLASIPLKPRYFSFFLRLILIVGTLFSPFVNLRSAAAFKLSEEGHIGISEEALEAEEVQRTIDGEVLTFTPTAIKEIIDANKATDSLIFPNNQVHPELHFDDESFAWATRRLVNLKNNIITKLTAASPDGEGARKDLGGALHTLQDFYAHTNWVELGNKGIDTRLGRSIYAGLPLDVATCPDDPGVLGGTGLTALTSGWFKVPLCVPPAGKCRHGIPLVCASGLNKDDSGRGANFDDAQSLAIEASIDFIEQILDAPGVKDNALATKALMRINGTLGMVIDDTSSMGGEISQVKTQVRQIIEDVRDSDQAPDEYLLMRFGDPSVGSSLITRDPDKFMAEVDAITVSGGGDCPELSQTALLRAISDSRRDSTLFVFTDASAKDSSLAGNVAAAAKEKRIKITSLLTGSCSPVDPAYVHITNETGGQLFTLNGLEVEKVFELVKPQLSGDFVSIFSSSGIADGDALTFEIPVDSTLSTVVFSVSIEDREAVVLRRPSGEAVNANDPDVEITPLTSGDIISIQAPATGNWSLDVTGVGTYSVMAKGNSAIDFRSFEFVQMTEGRHEGLFAIPGQPLGGSTQIGLASLLGPVASADFAFVDEGGNIIQPIDLALDNPYAASYEFVGEVVLPSQPFKVLASGLDTNEIPFQRLYPTRFAGQSVVVAVEESVESLVPGTTSSVSFSVHNLGTLATFLIQVADNQGYISHVAPTSVTLDNDERALVDVEIAVPVSATLGTEVSISAIATDEINPATTNSALLVLVVANQPTAIPVSEQPHNGYYIILPFVKN